MNAPDEQQLEHLLRRPPQPKPPQSLKEELIRQARSSAAPSRPSVLAGAREGWLRRWWPALAPAGFSLICAVVMAVQQREIRSIKEEIQTLSARVATETSAVPVSGSQANEITVDASAAEAREIARLKDVVGKLGADISQLEKLRLENLDLRAKLSAKPDSAFSADETAELERARERALRIQCINNLKQLGIAARVWAGDNMDHYPPDIICMSNEMNTPKILVCPSDQGRTVAANFGSFTAANCSYEWFLNPPGPDTEPTRVLTRCPIHGNVGLYDGSVQVGVAKAHPEWLVQRDGKLYYEPPSRP